MSLYLGDNLISGSFKTGASWEVGDVGISAFGIDEALNKRRYLNGQVISQAQFVEFTAMLKSRVSVYPNLATTEINWQAEVTNSKLGQCGKFVIDDVAGTIRLPKVVNINGLQNLTALGGIKAESLPNITGSISSKQLMRSIEAFSNSGALEVKDITSGTYLGTTQYSQGFEGKVLDFDSSRSSSTYQDDAPVQQEAVQYPYFIQVAAGVETSIDVSREIELNNPFSLLDYKYSEYELSNASWLLSNGQYNSGATYPAVYNFLLQIYNGTTTKAGVSVKLSTETYADTDFVVNTTDTTFRLPLKVALASGKGVAGNGKTLGLKTNNNDAGVILLGSGADGNAGSYLRATVQADNQNIGTSVSYSGAAGSTSTVVGLNTDPTKSGIETSSTGLYLYFYVGETVQDANIIAAASVLTDVADLKNASNFSSLGKETVVGWGMPDFSAGISVNATSYTAPKAGIVLINCVHVDNNSNNVSINGVQIYNFSMSGSYANGAMTPFETPVSAGDVITSNRNILKFYPYKGA